MGQLAEIGYNLILPVAGKAYFAAVLHCRKVSIVAVYAAFALEVGHPHCYNGPSGLYQFGRNGVHTLDIIARTFSYLDAVEVRNVLVVDTSEPQFDGLSRPILRYV